MSDVAHPVVIIGSGPAGYTAAIYAARADLEPLVVEGSDVPGGALMMTSDVENFPGFPTGVMGPRLVRDMRDQAERFGARFLAEQAVKLELGGEVKTVETAEGSLLRTSSVILATGSRYRTLGLLEEGRFAGKGLSWCATCDGAFHRGADVVVVGGGDSAMEEAIFLTRFARRVTVVHRRDSLRASRVMQARALANPKIEFAWDSVVERISGEANLEGVVIRNVRTHERTEIGAQGLFVAVGHDPNSELVRGQLALDDDGYIIVQHPTTATDAAGVFACGDVVDHHYRQAITAAGTGCSAALDAERYLSVRQQPVLPVIPAAGPATKSDPQIEEPTTMERAVTATDDSFDELVLTSDKPVLVDFWAEWCGPCQLMLPIMDELASTRSDDFLVVKVNVDTSPGVAERYDVKTLPAFKVFRHGDVVATFIGARTKTKLLEAVGLPA